MNEECAKNYSELINSKFICLRFFTVFGEWGRPDMLYLKYLDAIKKGKVIDLYNFGKHTRDFTYITDVIEILYKILLIKKKEYFQNNIFNICSGRPTNLLSFIKCLEKNYGKKCRIN